jgi:hypothetical protein
MPQESQHALQPRARTILAGSTLVGFLYARFFDFPSCAFSSNRRIVRPFAAIRVLAQPL